MNKLLTGMKSLEDALPKIALLLVVIYYVFTKSVASIPTVKATLNFGSLLPVRFLQMRARIRSIISSQESPMIGAERLFAAIVFI